MSYTNTRDGRQYLDAEATRMIGVTTAAIIEARNPEEGHTEWDSDYVSNVSMTVAEARVYLAAMRKDEMWAGWQLRIVAASDAGRYRLILTD